MTRPSRRLLTGLIVLALLAALSGFVARGFVSPAQEAARTKAPPPAFLTAKVAYGVLAAKVILRGDVDDVAPVVISVPASASQDAQVVTYLGVHTGSDVQDGEVVAAVNDRPMIVLQGAIPAFRSMSPGEDGTDVTELQTALERLGYPTGSDPAGHYAYGTEEAVRAYYRHAGYDVVLTTPTADTDLASAQAALGAAKSSLMAAKATLSHDTATGHPASDLSADQQAVAAAGSAVSSAGATVAKLQASTGATVPFGEVTFIPRLPSRVVSTAAAVGSEVGSSPGGTSTSASAASAPQSPVLTLGSGQVVVEGEVDAVDQQALRTGQAATVTDDSSGQVFSASVTAVASQPDSAASATGPQYKVTVTPTTDMSNLVGANVAVNIQTATSGRPAYLVPVAAVTTNALGSSTVTIADGGAGRVVAVRVGLSTDGLVAVEPVGSGLAAGELVVLGIGSTASQSSSGA